MRKEGRTDEQIHVTNLVFAFRNFANAPKNRMVLWLKVRDVREHGQF